MKITSVNNDFVKKLVKLSKKKYRDEASQLLVEGEHLYEEVLKAGIKHQTIGWNVARSSFARVVKGLVRRFGTATV